MKRMAIAGLLAAALALTPLSQPKALAWGCDGLGCCGGGGGGFGFNIGVSIGFNFQCSGMPSCGSPCMSGCDGGGMAYPGAGYSCPTGSCGSYAYGYPSYPASPMAAPASSGVQNAAYTYPAGYGYGYSQAPSYWYGH